MIRLVVDPNVLVSAAIVPGGTSADFIRLILDGKADLIVCPHLLEELRAVLRRPKFRRYLSVEQADRYVILIERIARHEPDPADPPRATRDPNDDYLVALARTAGAQALVSGDRDLLNADGLPIPVFTPRQTITRIGRTGKP